MGSFSIGHWVIVALVVLLVFGTKKLGSAGADLGKAIKGFKDEVKNKPETADENFHAKAATESDHVSRPGRNDAA